MLLTAALVCVVSSLATYYPAIRSSVIYPVIMLSGTIVCALLWVALVKKCKDNQAIAMWSFAWDFMIVMVYSVVPMLLNHKNPSIQSYLAVLLTLIGLLWLKSTLDVG
jgi:hypothetical protein